MKKIVTVTIRENTNGTGRNPIIRTTRINQNLLAREYSTRDMVAEIFDRAVKKLYGNGARFNQNLAGHRGLGRVFLYNKSSRVEDCISGIVDLTIE